MLIDKKGKVFGKINIIDLLLIIAIVAAVGLAGYKFLLKSEDISSDKNAVIKFYAEEVSDFVLDDTIHEGDVCSDVQTRAILGTVASVDINDSVCYAANSDGQWVKSSKPDFKSVMITAETKGTKFDHGIIIDSNKYYIGHSFTLAAGGAKIWLRVYDIEFRD